MFSKNQKRDKVKNFLELPGNNYQTKLDLLKIQLNNYIPIINQAADNDYLLDLKFCHIDASGTPDSGGYPGASELKELTFRLCFNYKNSAIVLNEITKLFYTSNVERIEKISKVLKASLSLVISVNNIKEFQSLILKLNDIDKQIITPIIILANKACYKDINSLLKDCHFGIVTIIETSEFNRLEPMKLFYCTSPTPSVEKINKVWLKLTSAIETTIAKARQLLFEEINGTLKSNPKEINYIIADYAISKIKRPRC